MARIELIISSGLKLKEFTIEDSKAIFELISKNKEQLSQFGDTTFKKYPSLTAVRESILRPKNPAKIRFGIWDKEILVGSINLTPISKKEVEVGYYLGKNFEGKGYVSRALVQILQYAFTTLDHTKVFAKTNPANKKSTKLLLKAGFLQKKQLTNSNDDHFSINKEDYLTKKQRENEL